MNWDNLFFRMKKWNTIVSIILIILVFAHGTIASLSFLNFYINANIIAIAAFIFLIVHTIFGIIFIVKSRTPKDDNDYLQSNEIFWIRRISGFLILILVFIHFTMYGHMVDGQFVLLRFTWWKLVIQLALIICVLIHILTNVKPVLVDSGISKKDIKPIDVVVIIFTLFFIIATVIYFISWQTGVFS